MDTVKKQGGGYNAQKMGKLDNESEELTHNKVNTEAGLALPKSALFCAVKTHPVDDTTAGTVPHVTNRVTRGSECDPTRG